ncbi:hypothetical protein BCR33DRAFT_724171 [Rhizoclosmatium globosum]|uniref:Uncharacterized protein n=1 Tax=Rhizoclosmatium globosum TaxID=329046 RepID=A0A1Y2B879_9FUNG|nr:hypothetical protein BCR33DRAFT_724171 [Rhizoclosmatium globosum]|eukprot:ORY30954.1 hypothetical protein BCR33DRAFT_724171 [Rhizoclosmatium globosum]
MLALVRLAEADLVSHVEILLSHIARNVNFLDTTGKDEHLVAFAYSTALKYNCLDLVESVRSKALSLSWLHLNAIWSELSRDRLSALNTDEYKWILRTILAKPFQSAAVVESLHRFLVEKELENDLKLLETALIRAGPKLALEMICKLFPSRRPPSTKPLNATAHVKRVIEGLNKSEMAQMDSNVIHDTLITLMSGMRGLDIGISKILTEAILAKPFPASDSKHMILQIHPMIVECRWDDLMATIESRLATVNPSVVLESLSLLVSRESLMSRINTWKGHLLRVLNGIKKETLATVDSEYLFTTAQGFLKVDSQVVKELINVIVRKPHLPPKESTFMALHRFIIERGWDDAMKNLEARIASYDIRVVMKSLNAVMEVPSLLDTLESWKVHILRLASGFRREEIVKLGEAELISAVKLFMKCQFVELARSFVRALVVLPTTSVGYEIHVMVLEKTWLDEMRCVELRMREEKSVALSVRLMELFKHPMFHTSLQFRAHCERVMDMFVQKDWSGFNATPESGKEFAKFYVTLLRFAFMDSLERVGAKAGELSLTNLVLVVYDSLKFLSKLIKLQEAHAEGGELSAKDEMAVKNSVQLQGVVHQLTLSLLSRKPSNAKDYLQVIPCLELVCSKISFMDLEQPLTLRKAFIKTTFELDATPTHNTQPGDFLQKLISHIHTHSPILKRELTTAPLRTLVQKRFTQVETFLQTTPSASPTSWAQPHANLSLCKIDWKDQILTFLKGNLSEYRVRAQFGSLQAANEYSDQFNKFVARREFGVYASARASMMGGAGTAGVVIKKDKSYQDAMHKKYIQLGSERGILVELLGIKNKV